MRMPRLHRGLGGMAELVRVAELSAQPPDGVEALRSLAALGHEGVASAVAAIRQRIGIGQAELAMLVGVQPSVIAVWEAGHVAPRLHHLFRLVAVLDEHERGSGPDGRVR
jgi:DNA-binding XRE family transcriptional regulator